MRLLALLLSAALLAPAAGLRAHAQHVADTSFTWQSYAQIASCEVEVFRRPGEERRPYTIVVREVAANRGPSTVDDVDYLVREVGRHFDIDPAKAYWVFHWGAFSYPGAAGDKELFLRATFRRTGTLRLSTARWDVITRARVEEYTDRHY